MYRHYTVTQMGTDFYAGTDRDKAEDALRTHLRADDAVAGKPHIGTAKLAASMLTEAEQTGARTSGSVGVTVASEAEVWAKQAHRLGVDAAATAATWAGDGMSASYARVALGYMEDGDPRADEYLPPYPNLSGEWADETTSHSLFSDLVGREPVLDSLSAETEDGGLMDALCDAWEAGVEETFTGQCEIALAELAAPTEDEIEESTQGYLRAAIWTDSDRDENPLDDRFGVEDFSPDAVEMARGYVAAFIEANGDDLVRFGRLTGRDFPSHGHDLWLTRNGHGAGFWDRYMEAPTDDRDEAKRIGDALSENVSRNEIHVWEGNAGLLYFA